MRSIPPSTTRTDQILATILVLTTVAAIATTLYVIMIPKEGEKFTEFYILGEKGMAANYPTNIFIGSNHSVYIGIANHEYRTVNYTIETWIMSMVNEGVTNTSTITAMDLLDRFPVIVSHNETVIMPYYFFVNKSGYNRIEFLLFNESIPDNSSTGMDRINASYRNLHLWVAARP